MVATARLEIHMSEITQQCLRRMSADLGVTMTDLVRYALTDLFRWYNLTRVDEEREEIAQTIRERLARFDAGE